MEDNAQQPSDELSQYQPSTVIVGGVGAQEQPVTYVQSDSTLVHKATMKRLFEYIMIGAACLVVLGFFVPNGYALIMLGVPALFIGMIISLILGFKRKNSINVQTDNNSITPEKKNTVLVVFKVIAIIIGILGALWMAFMALIFVGFIVLVSLAGSGDNQS